MDKIKVLNLIWSMGDGGAQRILLNYLRDFKNDKDIEFKLLVYDKCTKSYCNDVIKENNYNVEYLGNKKSILRYVPIFRKKFNLIKIRKTIKEAIEKYNPDIVHVHISPLLRFVLDPIVQCGVPIRFNTLHSNPLRFKGRDLKYIKRAFKEENFIPICLNEEQKNIAKNYYGFKKYEIVRNGIDIEKIKSLKLPKAKARKLFNIANDDFIVVGVGRLNPVKRFDFLIKIFAELIKIKTNAKLLIAGDGVEYNHLKKLIDEMKLTDKVTLLGNINNITDLYCAADVLAMTSESEASPLTLIEAQVCNLRCVISDGVPNESIVTNKVKKMSKKSSEKKWAKALSEINYKGKKVVNMKVYDINEASKQMKNVYLKYWKEYHEKR